MAYSFNVDDYLSSSATTHPNKVAIVDHNGTRRTTFAQLNDMGKRLGSHLVAQGLERAPILLVLPKSMEALGCFAGVTKSNNFYTIFDESAPIERLHKVLSVFAPRVIITRRDYPQRQALESLARELLPEVTCLAVEDVGSFPIDEEALATRRRSHIDTDLLYVLFTSGSTGEPKGVTICHKSVIDYTEWLYGHFGFNERTVFLNQAPFYFDNSITDIYSTFKTGATLHLIDSALFTFPPKVLDYMVRQQITTIFWVPSVLCYFANVNVLAAYGPKLTSLKQVLFCGEPMPNKQLNQWRRHVPQCTYTNLYGPTEITDVCAYFDVERACGDDEILPIGFACANTELLVFAHDDASSASSTPEANAEPATADQYRLITPQEVGVKGELYVRGTSLSLGYYGQKAKTRERFVQNPLHDNYLDLIYATGDIVAYNEHGELVCYGRSDSQIKLQGHRIELGEIEALVTAQPEVTGCACVFTHHIALFYSSKQGQELDLKAYLKDKLPTYMMPSQFIVWPRFALNQNGKVDRLQLKAWLTQAH